MFDVSEETQVTLLLTLTLTKNLSNNAFKPLNSIEFLNLAKFIMDRGYKVSDLLKPNANEVISEATGIVDPERIKTLLGQGFLMAQKVDSWKSRSIWVLSQFDKKYPTRFIKALGQDLPMLIFGSGDPALLDAGGLAVIGTKNADAPLIKDAEGIASHFAFSGKAIISASLSEIEQATVRAALDASGLVISVLSHNLEEAVLEPQYRIPFKESRLVLVSLFPPDARFNRFDDLKKNKLIYALADAALIINLDHPKDGEWIGVLEQLEELKSSKIYLYSTGIQLSALNILRSKGALLWQDPQSIDDRNQVLPINNLDLHHSPVQSQFTFEDLA